MIAAIRARSVSAQHLVVAVDGRSGSGKSTVAKDGSYPLHRTPTELAPNPVVLLDGAYTARPELAEVLDLTVLVEAAPSTREARLKAREAADFLRQWRAKWEQAEEYYFGHVRSPSTFDVVLQTDGDAA